MQLDERQWKKLEAILASAQGAGRPGKNDRNFIEAVLWWRRTGVPWRDLPEEFCAWKTVFNRFDRWAKIGKWERVLEGLQTDRDNESLPLHVAQSGHVHGHVYTPSGIAKRVVHGPEFRDTP